MKELSKLNDAHTKDVEKHHKYLIENSKKLLKDLPWEIDVIKQLKIGYDSKRLCFVFPIYNETCDLVNIYWHKGEKHHPKFIFGAPTEFLYPLPLIKKYHPSEPLFYCEGMKDVATLLSNGFNAVSHLKGALTIPIDLSQLYGFQEVITVFDYDNAGIRGADKLAEKLVKEF